jgi:hypothetical protein
MKMLAAKFEGKISVSRSRRRMLKWILKRGTKTSIGFIWLRTLALNTAMNVRVS